MVLHNVDDVSCEWLTARIGDRYPLAEASVTSVVAGSRHVGQAAHANQLMLRWSQPVEPPVPQRLYLKTGTVPTAPLLDREVRAYQWLASTAGDRTLLPYCYDAQSCPETGRYHVLMEDVSRTHRSVGIGLPPTETEARLMVQTLAQLHARWWGHPQLTEFDRAPVTEFQMHRLFGYAMSHFDAFCERLAGRWMPEDPALFYHVLQGGLQLGKARLRSGEPLTVVHGDSHAQNFFLPRENSDPVGPVYLIDWQGPVWQWRVWTGPCDLTYLFARWGGGLSPSLERSLLEFYYAQLQHEGVAAYSQEAMWRDFGLGLAMGLAIVVHEAMARQAIFWYPQLSRLLASLREQRDLLPEWS